MPPPCDKRRAAPNGRGGAGFLLENEDLLLRFCENAAISPKELHLARYRLGGTL